MGCWVLPGVYGYRSKYRANTRKKLKCTLNQRDKIEMLEEWMDKGGVTKYTE
jgi:hypothetical protein